MINTSQIYKEEIRNLFNRKIYGKVQIDYSDPEIDQGVSANADNVNHTSYINQVFDGKPDPTFKYISLGDWVLDGTYCIAPTPEEVENDGIQMGHWGETLSNSTGVFTIPQNIVITSQPRLIRSLKLYGDSLRNEFPVNFKMFLKNDLGITVHTETVIGNINVYWEKEITPAIDIVEIKIEITGWSKANSVIKILETFSSIQEIYEGEDIISINFLEEREVSQGSLPVGNISSNEIEIKLNNISRKFDTGNKGSNLYGLIKPNRRVKAWIGTESQLIPLGVFWTKDWTVPQDGVTASTIARDRFDRLRGTTYSTSIVQINKTMYDLAKMVLDDALISEEYYWIDEELKNFTVPYAYFESQTHREALRKIATACLGQAYCDRQGIIRLEGSSYTLLQPESPPVEISRDDYFKKDNPSRQSDIANSIVVETQPLKLGAAEEIYTSNEPTPIIANINKVVTVQFNHTPCIDVNISLTGTGTIVDSKIYAWGADVTVKSVTNGSFTLAANGKPLKVINKDKIIVEDNPSIIDNGRVEYKMPLNPLIQTRAIGQQIAETLLAYYKDPRRDLEVEWRGNPALTLGDIVMVDDYPRGNGSNMGYYYITKNELEYKGYLRAKLSGRRTL